MENPIKMNDLGVPIFLETPIWIILSQYEDAYLTNQYFMVHVTCGFLIKAHLLN